MSHARKESTPLASPVIVISMPVRAQQESPSTNQDLVLTLRAIACPAFRTSHFAYGFHRAQWAAGTTTVYGCIRSDHGRRRPQ